MLTLNFQNKIEIGHSFLNEVSVLTQNYARTAPEKLLINSILDYITNYCDSSEWNWASLESCLRKCEKHGSEQSEYEALLQKLREAGCTEGPAVKQYDIFALICGGKSANDSYKYINANVGRALAAVYNRTELPAWP